MNHKWQSSSTSYFRSEALNVSFYIITTYSKGQIDLKQKGDWNSLMFYNISLFLPATLVLAKYHKMTILISLQIIFQISQVTPASMKLTVIA